MTVFIVETDDYNSAVVGVRSTLDLAVQLAQERGYAMIISEYEVDGGRLGTACEVDGDTVAFPTPPAPYIVPPTRCSLCGAINPHPIIVSRDGGSYCLCTKPAIPGL